MSLNPKFVPWVFALVGLAAFDVGWHGRSRPPVLPAFRPPVVDTRPAEEPQVAAEEPEVRLPEKPPPPPPVEAPAPRVEAAPPPPQKPAEAPKPTGPSIIGTWRVTEMSMNGQPSPDMSQMSMTFTFKADGTMTMVNEVPSAGVKKEQEGTYEIAGDQITIQVEQHPQTMTFSFEGNDRLVLSLQQQQMQMRMVLTRV
jgi:hypothetical protein